MPSGISDISLGISVPLHRYANIDVASGRQVRRRMIAWGHACAFGKAALRSDHDGETQFQGERGIESGGMKQERRGFTPAQRLGTGRNLPHPTAVVNLFQAGN
jgi:hypothetical protein